MPEPPRPPLGLSDLRRGGVVGELLFLFECVALEPTQLKPIAARLGLTVQAASHTYRRLVSRGLVEVHEGRYRPTVRGVAYLHEGLDRLGEDVAGRLERLNVVRSTRALALDPIDAGDPVALELRDGLLAARSGARGSSRGLARTSARPGEIVEVHRLEGIVPIHPGRIRVWTLPGPGPYGASLVARLRSLLARDGGDGLLAAPGLEAYHLLEQATGRPILRFGVAPACREASAVGVPSTVVLRPAELPRFLAEFGEPSPPPLEVRTLEGRAPPAQWPGPRRSSRARRSSSALRSSTAPSPKSSARSRSARPST